MSGGTKELGKWEEQYHPAAGEGLLLELCGVSRMEKGSKVGIVCCSNGQPQTARNKMERLGDTLRQLGLVPVFGRHIYEELSIFSGSGEERAESLMDFYRDDEIRAIFDVSGGDIANEVLSWLDFDLISRSNKSFWGYSDLTTVINGIYARTGRCSVLYQIRNLISKDAEKQKTAFANTIFGGEDDLFTFSYEFVQKEEMRGIVVGGNIRCLLKLAGTEYWPDMREKILLLESRGGEVAQMVTYLNQLKQIGVFEQVRGVLLGTFTKMEEGKCSPDIIKLVKRYAGEELPIAKTYEIGHGTDSKGIVIGEEIALRNVSYCYCRGV